ncbi:MAG: hypothetical protein P8Y18_07915 [Candidatus Bathyarchaeota archaeon]
MSLVAKYKISIFGVALTFFVFMLILLLNSFPADYRIANNDLASFLNTGSLMPLFHLASELIGEVGVIFRFTGACFFLALTYTLIKKKTLSWSHLKKAVLLEGIYYIFNTIFIIYLIIRALTSPDASSATILTYYGAASSYAVQAIIVTPTFLKLYHKLRSNRLNIPEISKWSALAITALIFGLWIKHLMLAIYAIGIDFSNFSYLLGSLNSTFTLLISGLLLIASFMPLYKKTSSIINTKVLGLAFISAGVYTTIYLSVALVNSQYMNWVSLIDWWTIAFIVLGLSFFIYRKE